MGHEKSFFSWKLSAMLGAVGGLTLIASPDFDFNKSNFHLEDYTLLHIAMMPAYLVIEAGLGHMVKVVDEKILFRVYNYFENRLKYDHLNH